MNDIALSRRALIARLGGAALFARMGQMNALAQASSSDYKALVCIFLLGGNDGHNTVVPLQQAQFDLYRAARGSLALPDGNGPLVQTSTPSGEAYGLNNGLSPLQPLWQQNKLAIVANVGMLVQPTTRQQFMSNAVPLPTNLFSHPDQIAQMQSGVPSTSGGTGWGARAADMVALTNGASLFPPSISMSGPALFCTGNVVQSASFLPGNDLTMAGMSMWPQAAADARKAGVQQLLQLDSGLALVQAANKVRKEAMDLNAMLNGLSANVTTPFPGTTLGRQLQQVAKIIKLRSSTGMKRQVFFCSLGGFDTHGSQSWQHWDLLRQVSLAMAAFYNSTIELGVAGNVTTFTQSDFGRTLQPSGQGSDHGWGNHYLVMGGAVQGGRMFGQFPPLALGGPSDAGNRGVLIPTTSLDQYGATMASWFGVPAAQLASVFPNLANFPSASLGFLG